MTVSELRYVLAQLCEERDGNADLECVVETGDGPGVLVRSVTLARAVELDDAGDRRVVGLAVLLDTTG